jgi:hypothetical protein
MLKTMKIMALIAIILVGGVLGLFSYCNYVENPTSEFNSYEEMAASGIIARGWVSEFIPKSAYEIRERHNIDTNTVYMSFKYDSAEGDTLKGSCITLVANEKGWKYICPPYEGNTSVITLRKDGVGYYESHTDGLGY